VHAEERGHEQELRREVTVGDGVDRVGHRSVEAQLRCDGVRVERQR
jgi:hypothetical protein